MKENIFEKTIRESLKKKVQDFELDFIEDKDDLQDAFNYIVFAIENMLGLFEDIQDTIGYESLFMEKFSLREMSDESQRTVDEAILKIEEWERKVNQVRDMIQEYVERGSICRNGQENELDLREATKRINNYTELIEVLVSQILRDYENEPRNKRLEFYDATVSYANSIIAYNDAGRSLSGFRKAELLKVKF